MNLSIKIWLSLTCLLFTTWCSAQEETSISSLRPPTLLGALAPEYPVEKWINKASEKNDKKLTLLYFWSTSNPLPAYVDIPRFNKFAKEFKDRLNIIGLTADPVEYITNIDPAIEFPYAYAPQAVKNFKIKVYGYCYILNARGKVIYEGFPLLEGEIISEKFLKKLIRKHYKKK